MSSKETWAIKQPSVHLRLPGLNSLLSLAAPEFFFFCFVFVFFVRGIEGAKYVSEGEKSKTLPKMADFDHFFF